LLSKRKSSAEAAAAAAAAAQVPPVTMDDGVARQHQHQDVRVSVSGG
jgi:hypothetical protein